MTAPTAPGQGVADRIELPGGDIRECLYRLKNECEIEGLDGRPGFDAWCSWANKLLGTTARCSIDAAALAEPAADAVSMGEVERLIREAVALGRSNPPGSDSVPAAAEEAATARALAAVRELLIPSEDVAGVSDPWVDTRLVSLDDTVRFGLGYGGFDDLDNRMEMHVPGAGSYAVWGSGKRWSFYGGPDGMMAFESYSCEAHARADAEAYALSIKTAGEMVNAALLSAIAAKDTTIAAPRRDGGAPLDWHPPTEDDKLKMAVFGHGGLITWAEGAWHSLMLAEGETRIRPLQWTPTEVAAVPGLAEARDRAHIAAAPTGGTGAA